MCWKFSCNPKWVLNCFQLYFGLLGTSLLGSTELRFHKKVILIDSTYFHSKCCLHCIKFLPFYIGWEPKMKTFQGTRMWDLMLLSYLLSPQEYMHAFVYLFVCSLYMYFPVTNQEGLSHTVTNYQSINIKSWKCAFF